ncbi:hypothetical protein QR680_008931 [Steinernema hermaphroditum]|uniref:Uncharacterized protein n=1 Tax=Steinernema hermaphroditum TaxID=289476 RepID=A0AA39IKU1_9BILA|nr:hypothetical protein QR680_008931 [Steinernema hermaphroditum]
MPPSSSVPIAPPPLKVDPACGTLQRAHLRRRTCEVNPSDLQQSSTPTVQREAQPSFAVIDEEEPLALPPLAFPKSSLKQRRSRRRTLTCVVKAEDLIPEVRREELRVRFADEHIVEETKSAPTSQNLNWSLQKKTLGERIREFFSKKHNSDIENAFLEELGKEKSEKAKKDGLRDTIKSFMKPKQTYKVRKMEQQFAGEPPASQQC